MPIGDFVNNIPAPVFLLIHISAFRLRSRSDSIASSSLSPAQITNRLDTHRRALYH